LQYYNELIILVAKEVIRLPFGGGLAILTLRKRAKKKRATRLWRAGFP
jgi:hypothetical protein